MHIRWQSVRARLGDVIFGQSTDSGAVWYLEEIQGFYSDSINVEHSSKAWADGAWTGPGWYGPKDLLLKAALRVPPGRADVMESEIARLKRCLPVRQDAALLVETFTRPLVMNCRCVDTVKIEPYRAGAKISIPLICPDPVKYAADWESGGLDWQAWETGLPARRGAFMFPTRAPMIFKSEETSGVIDFDLPGSAQARGIVEISGPVTNPAVTDQYGWRFTIRGDIPEGQSLIVDPQTRSVTISETPVRARFSGDWPNLGPGKHRIAWEGSGGGNAMLKIKVVNAWR